MTFKFNHAIRFFVGWVGGEAMALNSEVYKMAEPGLSKHIKWYENLFIKIKLYLTTGLCLHTLSTIILSVSIYPLQFSIKIQHVFPQFYTLTR